jgi:hypothetical protein
MDYTSSGPVGTVAFMVKSASHSNLSVATHQITWNTEIFDIGANFASNVFTAPVTGKYQINISWYLYQIDLDAPYYETRIVTSNRTIEFIQDPGVFATDAIYWSTAHSHVFDMDSGDTATGKIQVGGGAAQMDVAAASYISGCLVG